MRPHATGLQARQVLRQLDMPSSRIRRVGQRRNIHWIVVGKKSRSVLCRYAPDRSRDDVQYELRLLEHLKRRGWPVPEPRSPLIEHAGALWCLYTHVLGRAPSARTEAGLRVQQLRQGRLLARLHADMSPLRAIGQRSGWRRADEGLWEREDKPPIEEVLRGFERQNPEPGRIFLTYADAARERLDVLLPQAPDPIVIHGDFAPWNLRYVRGQLSGILDFDSAHLDLRVADFALSWRGKHSWVIEGYEQEAPLEPIERGLIVPVFWAWIIASVVGGIDQGDTSPEMAEWAVSHLLRTDVVQG